MGLCGSKPSPDSLEAVSIADASKESSPTEQSKKPLNIFLDATPADADDPTTPTLESTNSTDLVLDFDPSSISPDSDDNADEIAAKNESAQRKVSPPLIRRGSPAGRNIHPPTPTWDVAVPNKRFSSPNPNKSTPGHPPRHPDSIPRPRTASSAQSPVAKAESPITVQNSGSKTERVLFSHEKKAAVDADAKSPLKAVDIVPMTLETRARLERVESGLQATTSETPSASTDVKPEAASAEGNARRRMSDGDAETSVTSKLATLKALRQKSRRMNKASSGDSADAPEMFTFASTPIPPRSGMTHASNSNVSANASTDSFSDVIVDHITPTKEYNASARRLKVR